MTGRNIGKLLITNRTRERAEQLALKVNGSVIPFDSWSGALAESDIVISSVEIDNYIMRPDDIQRVNRKNRNAPLFIIDLGVPRNIDPQVKELENVFLYDLDALNTVINENLRRRRTEVPKVDAIIVDVLDELTQWYSSLEVNPTITALTKFMESIRQEEVAKNINRFHPEDRELVELITKRIINKIVHKPIVSLRKDHEIPVTERLQKMSIIQKLFGLAKSSKEDSHAD